MLQAIRLLTAGLFQRLETVFISLFFVYQLMGIDKAMLQATRLSEHKPTSPGDGFYLHHGMVESAHFE